jgi:hypothetical protein
MPVLRVAQVEEEGLPMYVLEAMDWPIELLLPVVVVVQDAAVNKRAPVVGSMVTTEVRMGARKLPEEQVMQPVHWVKEETKTVTEAEAEADIMEEARLSMTMAAGEAHPILGASWEEIPLLEMLQCLTLMAEI